MPKGYPHPHTWYKIKKSGIYIKGASGYDLEEDTEKIIHPWSFAKYSKKRKSKKKKNAKWILSDNEIKAVMEIIVDIKNGLIKNRQELEN